MKRLACGVFTLVGAVLFNGCAGTGYPPYYQQHQKALAGTAMGAAGGALLGGAVTQDSDGAVVGGLLGGAAGGLMGHSMDKAQRPPQYYGYNAYPQPYYEGGHRRRHHHRHDDDD